MERTLRKSFDDETLHNKKLKCKQKKKRGVKSESAEELSDELDDVVLSVIPSFPKTTKSKEIYNICGEFGKDKELWFGYLLYASWNHAKCSVPDTPVNLYAIFVHIK